MIGRDDSLAIMKLLQAPGLGPAKVNAILNWGRQQGKSPADLCQHPDLLKSRLTAEQVLAIQSARDEVTDSQFGEEIQLISILDCEYPVSLQAGMNGKAPPLLYCRGNLALLNKPTVGICGSRKASEKGIATAHDCAEQLALSELVRIQRFKKERWRIIEMYKDREGAQELSALIQRMCRLIDDGLDLVMSDRYSTKDRKFYARNMGKILGTEIFEILNEIYIEHPDLIPPGFLPTNEDPKKQLADLIGTTQSVISRLEDSDYDGHSLTMLHRIAEVLGWRLIVAMEPNRPKTVAVRNKKKNQKLVDEALADTNRKYGKMLKRLSQ